MVRLGDVSEVGIDERQLTRMSLDLDEVRFRVEPGDVLCRSRGGNYRVAVVGGLSQPTVALSPLYIYRANRTRLLPEFAAWWLNTPETQNKIEAAAIGSNIKTVPIGAFGNIAIPIVPLELQERIVEVDRLNRGERALELLLAEKRADYVERVLTDAVSKSARDKEK